MKLTIKQTKALDILEDNIHTELVFGGGAGSAKSFLGCYWLLKNCIRYPGTRWLMGRSKLKTLKETTLNSFYEVTKMQGLNREGIWSFNAQSGIIRFYNGSEILLKDLFAYPSDPEFDELGSLEISGAFIDECGQITELAWNIVKSRIRYKLDEYNLIPKILGTCNPSTGWVYKNYYLPQKNQTISSEKMFLQALVTDNPFISKHYIENLKKLPKPQRDRLLYGKWEVADTNALCEYEAILDLFTNKQNVIGGKHYITADVARLGSDKAVICFWVGYVIREIHEFPISRINELADFINMLKNKHRVPNSQIICDEDGVGGGLVDILKCKGFVNNSKALNGENYQNLKTQCYYMLANAINGRDIYIHADLSTNQQDWIIEEMQQIKADNRDIDGKLRIINKEQVKQNIGRSPDYSDSIAMRMWFDLKPAGNISIAFV